MAHKTKVGGTAYEITGGKTKVGGTAYGIAGGRTLVGGTGYDILFGPTILPNFADNDWSTIIWACQNNAVPSTWAVGNQKNMTINGASYAIDIIGKNHDTYSDGSGTAPLTFQMHDIYNTATYNMNSDNINSGGWTSCAMRTTYLPAILALMPSEVQDGIKEVNKLTSAGGQSTTIKTTADKLFLLSEIEVNGSVPNSCAGEGTQYAYYSSGGSRQKGDMSKGWWERSPSTKNTTHFCSLTFFLGSLYTTHDYASYGKGVSFAFCF